MYTRKTRDVFLIMTNYGYGWEEEDREYDLKEAKQRKKEYLESTKADVRLERKREKISTVEG